MAIKRDVALFLLFAILCFDFGYAPLNRYDPRSSPMNDTIQYYQMTTFDYATVPPPYRYRVLTPTLAGLAQRGLARIGLGTWDTVLAGLLVVNSLYLALAGVLLTRIARFAADDPAVELLAPLLYLTAFPVVNGHLAGLVDAGEAFFIVSIMLATLSGQWKLLPVLFGAGVLAKETVAPFGFAFVAVWWVLGRLRRERSTSAGALVALGGAAGVSLVTILVVRTLVGGETYAGHSFAVARLAALPRNLAACVLSRGMIYSFACLAPLGLLALGRVPLRLRLASLAAGCVALLLAAYAEIGPNAYRPLFNTVGPLLAVASAICLCNWLARPQTQ